MEINIPVLLKTTHDMDLNGNDVADVLTAIFDDLEPEMFKESDVPLIVAILHNLYVEKDLATRYCVLKAFLKLEILTDELIVEKYHVDLLIAKSIVRKYTDTGPKVDTEKGAAFAYVSFLMNYHNYLPKTIISALVTLARQEQSIFKSLAVSYLSQAVLTIEETDYFPDIYPLIIHQLLTDNYIAYCGMIVYGLENRFSVIGDANTLRPLISPFSAVNTSAFPQNGIKALKYILSTWPGLIIFGVKNHGIEEIVKCIGHRPDKVSLLLIELVRLCINNISFTSAFSGMMMYSILKSTNLLHVLPYIAQKSKDALKLYELLRPIIREDCTLKGETEKKCEAYDFTKTINIMEDIQPTVQCVIQRNSTLWDWQAIINILTYAIPYSMTDFNSVPKQFYSNILDFFANTFPTLPQIKAYKIRPAIMATIKHLTKFQWGLDLIEMNSQLINAIHRTIKLVESQSIIDTMNPSWSLIDILMFLITDPNGVGICSRSGFLDDILSFGEKIVQPYNLEVLVSKFNFSPDTHLVIPMYSRILLIASPKMHEMALNMLWKKHDEIPDFACVIFKDFILPYAVTNMKLQKMEKLRDTIILICKIVSSDRICLSYCAKSQNIHNIFAKHFRYLYPYILCHEEALAYVDINKEIEWWLSDGGEQYIKLFDEAYEAAFTGKPFKEPPHIFGQLAKIKKGCDIIEPLIPKVIEQLTSEDEKICRASIIALGYFASSSLTKNRAENLNIAEEMLDKILPTSSPTILGTLIVSLSMFQRTPYFLEVLKKHNWTVYSYARKNCALPLDLEQVLTPCDPVKLDFHQIPNVPGKENICRMIKDLADPITCSNAVDELNQYEPKSDIKTPEMHIFSSKVMNEFLFPEKRRDTVDVIFKNVPMIALPEMDISEEETAMNAAIAAECPTLYTTLAESKIPVIPLKNISKKAKQKRYPEVYLSEEDFMSVTNVTKEEFYNLPSAERERLRGMILQQ